MTKQIRFVIDGDNISPDTMDLTDALDILRDLSTAIYSTASAQGAKGSSAHLGLPKIEAGCVEVLIVANDQAEAGYNRVVLSIETGDPSLIPRRAVKSVRSLCEKAAAKSWTFELNGTTDHATKISPDMDPFSIPLMNGRTSLLIHLIRVGGEDNRTANVKLPNGDKLTADVVSEEVARQLGERLYEDFEVSGDATWNAHTMRLVAFRILDIGPYQEKTSDPLAALSEMARLSPTVWKDVNPDEYIRDLRAD